MQKLSETQIAVLTDACRRDDRSAFPVNPRLKGNAAGNVLKSLLNKGLLEEMVAGPDDTVWRHDEDNGPLTLRATPVACEALGAKATGEGRPAEAAQAPTRRTKGKKATRRGKATKSSAPAKTPAPAKVPRANTKQAQLIALLRRREGVTIEQAVKALAWQPHTVRGAIAGALKKKLGLNVTSEKIEGRGRVYRIAG
jgi:hypothetical protein